MSTTELYVWVAVSTVFLLVGVWIIDKASS